MKNFRGTVLRTAGRGSRESEYLHACVITDLPRCILLWYTYTVDARLHRGYLSGVTAMILRATELMHLTLGREAGTPESQFAVCIPTDSF